MFFLRYKRVNCSNDMFGICGRGDSFHDVMMTWFLITYVSQEQQDFIRTNCP